MVPSHVADDWLVNKLSFGERVVEQRGYRGKGVWYFWEAEQFWLYCGSGYS